MKNYEKLFECACSFLHWSLAHNRDPRMKPASSEGAAAYTGISTQLRGGTFTLPSEGRGVVNSLVGETRAPSQKLSILSWKFLEMILQTKRGPLESLPKILKND